jgi:hypothetical protein
MTENEKNRLHHILQSHFIKHLMSEAEKSEPRSGGFKIMA